MPAQYPFSAVVGSDDMTLALALTAIDPLIGGVLVRGEKGTAKTTTVRGFTEVLPPVPVYEGDRFSIDPEDPQADSPDGPFGSDTAVVTRPARLVELPAGAGDDRVTGTLHLDQALRAGVVEFEPGLLARAHRGLLYVDEINLLQDHLVDLLLDAAATGRVGVERDGISVEHAAWFVLIGTMNPEEGELRPQLLDRFGLTVEVAATREPAARAEVVRRRMAFDADPVGFAARWEDEQRAVRERLAAARQLVGGIALDDGTLTTIAEICAAFDVDGLRADLVTARAALAHAAWQGRTYVIRADVRAAARLALPHRRRRNPFDEPGLDEERLDELLGPDDSGPDDPDPGGPGGGTDAEGAGSADTGREGTAEGAGGEDAGGEAASEPGTPEPATSDTRDGPRPAPPGSENPTPEQGEQGERGDPSGREPDPSSAGTSVPPAGPGGRARLLVVRGTGEGQSGRRSRARTPQGVTIGPRRDGAGQGRPHLPGTLTAAAPHQRLRGGLTAGRGLIVTPDDLRRAETVGRESNLVLLCVDASGSMAARRRMEQVKTAVLSLLLDAYRRRDKVALVTFRRDAAEVALPPTSSVDVASRRLTDLPAGGRTPLAEGLERSAELLRREARRDPTRRPLLVVVTDGRATYGRDPLGRAHTVAGHLAASGVDGAVVDCETGNFRMGLAARLAECLRAEHLPLGEVTAEGLTGVVRDATTPYRGVA